MIAQLFWGLGYLLVVLPCYTPLWLVFAALGDPPVPIRYLSHILLGWIVMDLYGQARPDPMKQRRVAS